LEPACSGAGETGNRNYTTISDSDLTGWGGFGGASLIFGAGGAVSFDGNSWTRSIGVGLDIGFSVGFGFTDYGTAWPIESLPEALSDLAEFYQDAFKNECGN
jgi:hypothetical protein